MVQRNLLVYRYGWLIIVSGFFEPLFYLLGIGLGLGRMVPRIDGVSYAAFVAPGLLAASCMNGAITDGCFNIFFKLHFQRTYDGVLATPMCVPDVAFGEMLWAIMRGSTYAVAFLLVLFLVGAGGGTPIILSGLGVLALPAAAFVAATFSAMTLCVATFVRKVQDFDIVMGLGIMPMFLFSGTFFPIERVPPALRWIVEVLPLYHGVAILRPLTTGAVDRRVFAHAAYLLIVGSVAFLVALRRLERTLVK
jgi:lipooligosaccharide transport system permease protein